MSRERYAPYVGISGLVSPTQQSRYETTFDRPPLKGERMLLLGVKTVHTTQWLDRENRYGADWYPVGAKSFAAALWPKYLSDPDEMGVAQMYLDPAALDDDPCYPEKFVDRVLERGQDWLTHIQFDLLPYHEPSEYDWGTLVHRVRSNGVGVVLQCHGPAMQQGPAGAIARLRRLPPVDYVLFDASHGKGERLDAEALLPFLDAAYADKELASRGTNFGIAGGLNGEVVQKAMPRILQAHPGVSWDAESRLHHPWKSDYAYRGRLDDDQVSEYLFASCEVLMGYHTTPVGRDT